MATNLPPAKRKLSWMDILFQSLAVVIPTLLGSLAEKFNNPLITIEPSATDKTLANVIKGFLPK